jgi:hypothetical protein
MNAIICFNLAGRQGKASRKATMKTLPKALVTIEAILDEHAILRFECLAYMFSRPARLGLKSVRVWVFGTH